MQPKYFGPYEIHSEIARGGQGAVYRAIHSRLGTPVAIKILLDPEAQSDIKRFKQEAQVLARLRHPNILQVVDFGMTNNYPYIAMEYIEGDSLKTLLRQGYRSGEALKKLITVAETLGYCHEKGIVHRDLKPDNIVIEHASGRPVLIDFGLIKRDKDRMGLKSIDRSRLSMMGEVKGTPHFMAPEQLDPSFGGEGPACDIYALGGILFVILTGRTPFEGTTNINLMVKKMRDAAPDPREFNPDINPILAELCNSCLAIEQDDRPVSAEMFAETLQEGMYTPRKIKRRRRYGPALLAGGLLAAAGGGYFALKSPRQTPELPTTEIPTPENIAEPSPPAPIATRQLPARVSSSVPPAPVVALDVLIQDFDEAFQAKDTQEMLEVAEQIIEHYPGFYRGYLYRATAYSGIIDQEPHHKLRVQYRQQMLADVDRAISLTDNEQENLRLRQIKQQLLQTR